MNPEKIRLPGFVVAELFRGNLVAAGEPQPEAKVIQKTAPPKTGKQWFLGNNEKNICILVSDKEAVYLNDDSLQFLSSILSACKLNLGDVAIINHNHTPVNYTGLQQQLAPKFLLLFNITAQQIELPFTVPFYQVQPYDQCHFLLLPALENMLGNTQEAKLEKSRLWLSLKKMFHI